MKPKSAFRRVVIALVVVALCWLASRAVALEPDEIALVVNSNVPEGAVLAEFYAHQRHIPDQRIIVLDLPKTDNISTRMYEDQVVPQVRDFLHNAKLENRVKCLVTFYGVPLAIDARVNTPEETDEQTDTRTQLIGMAEVIRPGVESVEALAKKLNVSFSPEKDGGLEHLLERENRASREIGIQLEQLPDPQRKAQLALEYYKDAEQLLGGAATIKIKQLSALASGTTQPADDTLQQAIAHYQEMVRQAGELESKPDDATARLHLRQIVRDNFGLLKYSNLLHDQLDYLDTSNNGVANTAASFDNELSMVLWNRYQHKGFRPNPLYYASHERTGFHTLMVMRLDAPQPETVKAMITTSIQVEDQGLQGQVVIDSRGIKPGEELAGEAGYGTYDQYLRDLATLLTQRTKLKVLLDEKPTVLPPGSAEQVALYCGWYSLRNYVPCCKFNPGAVGYHIASYELVSLRQPGETGWVHGLLNDGVVGTLGPVAEPFLGTFPRPDEFFPLLLTGRLTLAEVYWKTEPTVSWMQCCIGDPLYTPYKKDPQLGDLDLPTSLRQVFESMGP